MSYKLAMERENKSTRQDMQKKLEKQTTALIVTGATLKALTEQRIGKGVHLRSLLSYLFAILLVVYMCVLFASIIEQ